MFNATPIWGLSTMKNILVIAPHPDDETLGCGGTLFRHYAEGDSIHWLIMTKASVKNGFSLAIMNKQKMCVEEASNMYKFASCTWLDFKPAALEDVPKKDIIASIASCINNIKPHTIYLPHPWDAHSDHKITFESAWSSSKIFRYPFIKKILCMETLSETDFSPPYIHNQFSPSVFVDISEYIKYKIAAMAIYSDQMGVHPFPRSFEAMEAQAILRGVATGTARAEAFMLLKEII